MKPKKLGIVLVVLAMVVTTMVGYSLYKKEQERLKLLMQEEQLQVVLSHYGEIVQTKKMALLYQKQENQYVLSGSLGKGEVVTLAKQDIDYATEYFLCEEYEGYYVYYQDVMPVEEDVVYSTRHKNYIPFNENVVVDDQTVLYDDKWNVVLSLPMSASFPILVKEDDYYGVDYNDRLLWIYKNDAKEVVSADNSSAKIATGIRAVCYHELYDEKVRSCGKIICHPLSQIRSHFAYLRDAGYFTMSMQDMLWYIEGKANMPYKSVCLTFDDGGEDTKLLVQMLEEYDLHATLFLIANKYADYMISDNLELHSHTYQLHTKGHCSIGKRGSAILCKSKDEVLADLLKSREVLNGANAFCYPYYEYNDKVIDILKEAGFKMAFKGNEGLIRVGDDPYTISRFTFHNESTLRDLRAVLHTEW